MASVGRGEAPTRGRHPRPARDRGLSWHWARAAGDVAVEAAPSAARTAPNPTGEFRFGAVLHTVLGTYAGAISQQRPRSSSAGLPCGAHRPAVGPAVPVCALPRPGSDLRLLRPRPDLLCRGLRATGPPRRATRCRPALPDELVRPAVACRAVPPLSRAAKERDASGFTAAALE